MDILVIIFVMLDELIMFKSKFLLILISAFEVSNDGFSAMYVLGMYNNKLIKYILII
jgi:hypothetical protein